MTTWEKVGSADQAVPGGRYRSRYYLNVPYSTTLALLISSAVTSSKALLALSGIHVESVETISPELTDQANAVSGSRYPRWEIRVTWQKG